MTSSCMFVLHLNVITVLLGWLPLLSSTYRHADSKELKRIPKATSLPLRTNYSIADEKAAGEEMLLPYEGIEPDEGKLLCLSTK
jgi:hypothetical protein